MSKKYLDINVYDAANERIDFIFKNFKRIYISFSGGKDSAVMLNLVLDYMRKNEIKNKIGVLFIDLEGNYKLTIEHIQDMMIDNELIDPYWICLPLNLRNSVSVYQPFWCAWDENQKDKWIREMPNCAINIHNHKFDFFKPRMEFEQFVVEFGKWYSDGEDAACLVGIRSDESLNRYRTISSINKKTYQNKSWSTKIEENLFNFYPIYDWVTQDIWIANAKTSWKYNKLYDMFYKSGISIHDMRICQPYGDDQRIGLSLFRIIEPETWAKVVNRVSGANFGNIYCGDKILGYNNVKLPKNHTWKSYTKLLLSSLPAATKENYTKRFVKFMKYWSNKGCPVDEKFFNDLPCNAKITNKLSNRGLKNKFIVKYKKIHDSLNCKIESNKHAPTWRRMAICILKNDHLCKSLSFSQTLDQAKRQKELAKKYKRL